MAECEAIGKQSLLIKQLATNGINGDGWKVRSANHLNAGLLIEALFYVYCGFIEFMQGLHRVR